MDTPTPEDEPAADPDAADAPPPASSDLERQLDSLLSSLERPGGVPAPAPAPGSGSGSGSGTTLGVGGAAGATAVVDAMVDQRVEAAIAEAAVGEAGSPPLAGDDLEVMDLDALLAAEAGSAFAEEEAGLPTPPPPPPGAAAATAPQEDDIFDLASLEREAAGLAAEPPEPLEAPEALAEAARDAPEPQPDGEAEPGPAPEPPPEAAPPAAEEPAAPPAPRPARGPRSPRGRRRLIRPVAELLDAPVRRLGPTLPAAVGEEAADRSRAVRLCLGLAGVCLALPGLLMLALGVASRLGPG